MGGEIPLLCFIAVAFFFCGHKRTGQGARGR